MRVTLSLTLFLKMIASAGYTFSREAFNRLNPNVKTTVMDQLLEDIVTHSTISQKRMTSGSNKSKMKNLNFISILQING